MFDLFCAFARYVVEYAADWTLVGVTVLSAAASTAVAVAAVMTSKKSVQVADSALEETRRNEAQRQSEAHIVEANEYELRLDRAIGELITAVHEYLSLLESARCALRRNPTTSLGGVAVYNQLAVPSAHPVYSAAALFHLSAKGPDLETAGLVRYLISVCNLESPSTRAQEALGDLPAVLLDWRTIHMDHTEAGTDLRRLANRVLDSPRSSQDSTA